MKRDMDLIRKILFLCENHEESSLPWGIEIEGYTPQQIGYHNYLIVDDGLAEGIDVRHTGSGGIHYELSNLTSKGHDFIEKIREDTTWNKIKRFAQEKSIDFTVGGLIWVADKLSRGA